jgi:hypothetical protein
MSTTRERYQNPTVGNTVTLRLFVYNQNNFSNVNSIEKIEIYRVNDNSSINDPNARTLVTTVTQISQDSTGKYYIDLPTDFPTYTTGVYVDIWKINFRDDEGTSEIVNTFNLYPDVWYTTPIPVVYDFSFAFRPNRFRKGSKQYIICQITPNVPKGTDLQRYYENLIISSDVKISIVQKCGDCLPEEEDLRTIVSEASTDYREKNYAYYLLDTTDIEAGIYDVWFTLLIGENTFVSDRMNLQIYK